jgi:glutamate carboxypeptidase
VGNFDIHCHGKAAHAGVEPEKGTNTVVELAHQILAVASFPRPDLGTTANVTTVSGGIAENVIPDFARASVDVRFSSVEEARRIEACFQNLCMTTHVEGVRVEVRGEINRLPMVPSEATLRLWDQLAHIGKQLGLEMEWIATGGASDGNYTSALGIATIDALGPRGGSAHSKEEYLELDSIVPNIHLICEFLKAAAEGRLP